MLGRREILRANSRRAVTLRRCTTLGSSRRAGRRCLETASPASAPSGTVSPAGERTQWCKRVCLGMRPGPGPRLAQRAKPNRAARTLGDASGPPAVAVPNTAPTRANCKSPPYPRTTSRTVPSRLKPRASSLGRRSGQEVFNGERIGGVLAGASAVRCRPETYSPQARALGCLSRECLTILKALREVGEVVGLGGAVHLRRTERRQGGICVSQRAL